MMLQGVFFLAGLIQYVRLSPLHGRKRFKSKTISKESIFAYTRSGGFLGFQRVGWIFQPTLHHKVTHLESQRSQLPTHQQRQPLAKKQEKLFF